jgi:hypothetical protein
MCAAAAGELDPAQVLGSAAARWRWYEIPTGAIGTYTFPTVPPTVTTVTSTFYDLGNPTLWGVPSIVAYASADDGIVAALDYVFKTESCALAFDALHARYPDSSFDHQDLAKVTIDDTVGKAKLTFERRTDASSPCTLRFERRLGPSVRER